MIAANSTWGKALADAAVSRLCTGPDWRQVRMTTAAAPPRKAFGVDCYMPGPASALRRYVDLARPVVFHGWLLAAARRPSRPSRPSSIASRCADFELHLRRLTLECSSAAWQLPGLRWHGQQATRP